MRGDQFDSTGVQFDPAANAEQRKTAWTRMGSASKLACASLPPVRVHPAPGRKILLTSDYHVFRAYRTFRKAGLEVVPSPIPDHTKRISFWWKRWPVFIELCIETSKIGYYAARGWI